MARNFAELRDAMSPEARARVEVRVEGELRSLDGGAMNKNEAAEYLKTIGPDEPVFVLRAQDRFSPYAIRRWADMVEAGSQPDTTSREKALRARFLAKDIEEWQARNKSKVPD